jgi:predicted RNA-binding Zn-ribbon protein involved in translation (DUF1610 family)
MTRVLLTISRTWTKWSLVRETLTTIHDKWPDALLIHGDHPRCDQVAAGIWHQLGGLTVAWPARWKVHGKAAGMIRNEAMVKAGADLCVAFIKDATRWHRPRSGRRYDSGRITYQYWCGSNYGDCGVESIGPDEPLCATCEGKSQPPRVCPASGRVDFVPRTKGRYFVCPVCGEPTAWRAGRWYEDGAKVVRHAPGEGLVDPCRIHGWHRIILHSGVVVCACTLREAP